MRMKAFAAAVLALMTVNCVQAAQPGWLDRVLSISNRSADVKPEAVIQLARQDFESVQINKSVIGTPITIGSKRYEHGIGTHSVSRILVYSPDPIARFSSEVGIDNNDRTSGGQGSVAFSVVSSGKELYRSKVLRGGQEPEKLNVAAGGVNLIELNVTDGGDGPGCDHADWADAVISTVGGKTLRLDEIGLGIIPGLAPKYPFSFVYDGKQSDDLLGGWKSEQRTENLDKDRTKTSIVWTDPATGLKVYWDSVRYSDYPAVDWILHFENTGKKDTPIIENIQALNVAFQSPMSKEAPYKLHKTNGAPANPTDYEVSTVALSDSHSETMGGGGGRSSNKDFPFFKIETAEGSAIIAVGWSGQWLARLECPDQTMLHVTAGMEKTHFLLHPGEKVRSPRMLVMFRPGDTLEANAEFRQLIYKHYAATRSGQKPLPTLFCNTCFTRGGGWLNECTAENQISLINAYAPLGLEALITDAGWFEGGWPEGAGNWNVRKDAYPNGMGPVAAAAKTKRMIYGLWFEPERVVGGTDLSRNHPQWVLKASNDPGADGPGSTGLLNFGLPEVQDYFFNIVKGYMELPGFRFYRQDFNMDPLPYWLHNDTPDRQGITEIKYLEGLYAYWDRIAKTWPDSIREECASGGRRIDLETIMRMHIHQDSDYWFDNDVDQAQTWALSQYLPNNLFTTPINRLDDYSFHSALPTTLCMGWIVDAPDFDQKRAKKLLDRYLEVRPLLIGAWYPLMPYTRDSAQWMVSQYHRPDMDQGMILAFRHSESAYASIDVTLHGLKADATYDISFDSTGKTVRMKGSDLMQKLHLEIMEKGRSELIVYKKAAS